MSASFGRVCPSADEVCTVCLELMRGALSVWLVVVQNTAGLIVHIRLCFASGPAVCLSVCLSVSLSVCLSVCLFSCLLALQPFYSFILLILLHVTGNQSSYRLTYPVWVVVGYVIRPQT